MKLKTLALHLAYDIGSAAIGLAAEKLRSGIVQRQNAPKAQGNDLQEIKDPFESSPIKVNARVAIAGGKFDKNLLDRTATQLVDYAPKLAVKLDEDGLITGLGHIDDPVVCSADADSLYIDGKKVSAIHGTKADPFVKIDGETYIRNEFIPGELELERTRVIELTDDDVSAINYGVNSIYHTHGQKGPVAAIKRDDLTKIFRILLKLQHKALANVES